jgi:outer membrane protein assembly factor BamB
MKGDDIFISTAEDTFLPWGKGMKAINTNTGNLLWEVELDRELTLAPVFTDNIIYLRTGRGVGSAYAIERSTGKILWKTDNTIISNLALSTKKDSVYVLNQSGELWKIDGSSGESEHIIEFTNTPFLINGPEEIVGGYELAYDNTENILYILLGDSRQLFAYQMN